MGTFVLLLKMATAVRTCGALARSAVASNSLVRVGCHLNRPAIPVSLLIKKLSTTPIRKLRSEKEITDWVGKVKACTHTTNGVTKSPTHGLFLHWPYACCNPL